MILFLVFFVRSTIPPQYKELVEKAIASSHIKVPKELRQETKFPGYYESTHFRLRLLKTLTNSETNDIKGFAFDTHNCAIVKRKSFNLTEDYAVADPKTQTIYVMNQIVAEDGKVIVYNSNKVSFFSIITDFVMESSSDLKSVNPNSLRIKRPKASIDLPIFWDQTRDRPKTFPLGESGVQVGAGSSLSFGITARFAFNNIWDASISFQFAFEGKFGAELIIPDDCIIELDDQELFSFKNPISGFGFDAKFLGIQISIGAHLNLVAELTDIRINIPIGFDLFKGHKFVATKYFEITPTSISDSKWEITQTSLPPGDSLSKALKNLEKASFDITIQLRPFLSLEFLVGDITTSLEAGLKLPLVVSIELNKYECRFPYLYSKLQIPIKMYFAFRGLQVFDYEIIKEAENEITLFKITIPPFCIGASSTHEDTSGDTYDLFIYSYGIYEKLTDNAPHLFKRLIVSSRGEYGDGSVDSFLFYPYTEFSGEDKKVDFLDKFVFPKHVTANQRIIYSLGAQSNLSSDENYYVSSPDYEILVKDLKFNENNEATISVEIPLYDDNNSDMTYLTSTIIKVPHIVLGQPFSTDSKQFIATIHTSHDFIKYGLYYLDSNNHFILDEDATFHSVYGNSSSAIKGFVKTKGYAFFKA